MSKLQVAEKVSQTNYLSNSGDENRNYDVKAKVTINADGSYSVKNGFVYVKGGDVTVASFEKTLPEAAPYSPTGGDPEQLRIIFPDNPTTIAVKAAMADVCAFIDEVSALANE